LLIEKWDFTLTLKGLLLEKNLMKLIREKKNREILLRNGKRKWKMLYFLSLKNSIQKLLLKN